VVDIVPVNSPLHMSPFLSFPQSPPKIEYAPRLGSLAWPCEFCSPLHYVVYLDLRFVFPIYYHFFPLCIMFLYIYNSVGYCPVFAISYFLLGYLVMESKQTGEGYGALISGHSACREHISDALLARPKHPSITFIFLFHLQL
jgi:hypothetical protein